MKKLILFIVWFTTTIFSTFAVDVDWFLYGEAFGGTTYEYAGYASAEGIDNANKMTITYTGDIYQLCLEGAAGATGILSFNPENNPFLKTIDGGVIVREGNNTTVSINLISCGFVGLTAFHVYNKVGIAEGSITIHSMTLEYDPDIKCAITATSVNDIMGFVNGGGDYAYNASVTLTATSETGYQFVQWDDGNTDNPRVVTAIKDKTYTAIFEGVPYRITAQSNNNTMGTVNGDGVYAYNTIATLIAMPNEGYKFAQWSDGNTDNPREIRVTEDNTYTAQFVAAFNIVTETENAYNLEIPDIAKNFIGTEQYGYICGIDLNYPTGTTSEDYKWMKLNVTGNLTTFRIGYGKSIVWLNQFNYRVIGKEIPTVEQLANADSLTIWIGLGSDGLEGVTTLHLHQGGYNGTGTIAVNEIVLYKEHPLKGTGTVKGGGEYANNSQVTLVAVPDNGCSFVHWNDGNIDNPRTITVTEDMVYTATFESLPYTVTVQSNNTAMGTVSGGGMYSYNTTTTLTATPAEGCEFIAWSDGVREATRTVVIYGDAIYTAYFKGDAYALQISDNTDVNFDSEDDFVLEEFWDRHEGFLIDKLVLASGNIPTNNPAGIWKVFYNTDYLYFLVNINDEKVYNTSRSWDGDGVELYYEGYTQEPVQLSYYVDLDSDPSGYSISNNVFYPYDKYAIARHEDGYFVKIRIPLSDLKLYGDNEYFRMELSNNQSDGQEVYDMTNESYYRQAQLTTWDSYEGHYMSTQYYSKVWFKKEQTLCSVTVNSSIEGTTSGSGSYFLGENVTISATPKIGYEFTQWDDGNTENPRIITVTSDKTYTATFSTTSYTIKVDANKETMGIVNGGGTYGYGATATLTATPNTGYEFVKWNDNVTTNPRTITVEKDSVYIAVFKAKKFDISIISNDDTWGSVEGEGTYEYGTIAVLKATPAAGCKFVKWNDGSTDNPHYVKVEKNKIYLATFAEGAPIEEEYGETIITEGVSIIPYETKVDFMWPSITDVVSYSLIIWADEAQGKKVCTLTFNASGQLTNIDFTQSLHPQSAEMEEEFDFTITGLTPGTTYTYTLDAKDAENEIIETKRGTFTTMGVNGATEITNAEIAAGINIYTDGRTIIVENATEAVTVSDALGRVIGRDDVHIVPTETRRFPVPSSGVYVVRIGDKTASVLVR